ncbi:MAG: chromosomal replication initiator protein DnaA [Candidatus Scalindua sp. AMX11]|nr:MAG: chromosomal replication initiator protein DnaA [Candidatus Scalindua sp.]NOG85003.1 chromosomal replication initiator protein DnaA [Planctomycetota bacterium]RZV93059.1 MAG: chromosomal replication initiator protein DnaA [Candidatus Scalindua sp. SCAELEC01]TDE66681.1 MAG: chromosomal replication initiator protein DnaA [Candidatus Scalindua sp. AMX11]GJQ57986.1 MAG: chromosomal replication initiator protein DnaA [Candidatus Scalindua sp.]
MSDLPLKEKDTWFSIREKIKEKISPQQFTTWFENLSLINLNRYEISIKVPNLFCKEWIEKNYMDVIVSAIFETINSKINISFVLDENKPEVVNSVPESIVPKTINNLSYINKNYTFDNFLVGPCNRLTHAAALAVAESPGTSYNPLFVHAQVGLGKTHLLQAIYLQQQARPHKTLFLPCESFINHYISTIRTGDWNGFRDMYRNIDFLLIDDVQFLAKSQSSREEFFHTFNSLYNRQKQIVLSSDCPPEEIPTIEERLISRFRWGLITRIDPPSFETSIAIIQKKAALANLEISNDVASFIAENASSNVREIEGTLVNIAKYSSINKDVVTLDLVKKVIEGFSERKKLLGIEDILKTVTRHFNIQISQILSKRKFQSITLPRQVAMYLARKFTNLSLQEIGGYLGGRDHTTVIHATEKIKKLNKTDRNISMMLRKVEKELTK